MKGVNVIILSGSCCNPQLAALDEKVQTRVKEIADNKQLQANISVVPISSATFGSIGVSKEVDKTVRELIATKGMSVLPIVFFDGSIAFYGGLASVKLIEEKMCLIAQSQTEVY